MSVQPRAEPLTIAGSPVQAEARAAARAQRRAWLYLWTAFAIWCTFVGTGLSIANTWRKTAFTSPPAQLVNKRGIVLYQGPHDVLPVSISERTPLEEGAVLEVPPSSEAVIQIGVDGSSVRLRPSSRLRLTTMRVGRFNRDLTQVRLEQLEGAANYTVAGDLPDGREVELRTPNTPQPNDGVKLTKGDYLVWVQPSGTRLISYSGQAKAEAGGVVYRLRDGKWVLLGPDRSDSKQALDLPEHLIKNRDFARGLGDAWSAIDIGEKGRPDIGGQRSLLDESVNNQVMHTLRITRETAKDTHNETGLRQDINREVSAYRNITFAAWVKVTRASLDGGGYAGSEYPMMFRVNYVAENGGTYTWAHGFYVKNETNRPADIGEQIPAGEWQRFSLDMTTLKDRPAYIASVEVLASGHDFEAQVADVELVAE